MKKTYNEKLNDVKDLPKIVDLSDKPDYVARYKTTTMYIASPQEYNHIMNMVPKGKIITGDKVRLFLADKAKTGTTCPLTAGIFTNICAYAAIERNDTSFPWWRTLKTLGELNEKYPGGIEKQKEYLTKEGFEIIKKGKKYFVKDYENSLWNIKI